MDARTKRAARTTRHKRIRRRIRGTADQPRLSVYRSNSHIYAQLIDDIEGRTLVAASSLDDTVEPDEDGGKIAVARRVGELIGKRATDAGFDTVVFDRGGFRYAGRIAALADAAREAGLKF